MSFLTPAFLFGALAVAIPVYIHLTNREKKEVVDFPSLMFLRRIPYRSVRRQRLRHLLLFALRCLALFLVALAFARPFFESARTATAAALGPREVVFLVDHSYSMGYQDRLARAKAELSGRVQSLGPEDRGSLVAFSDRAEIVVRSTVDREELARHVEELELSARTTRFGPALKLAKKIVDESDLSRQEVVLVSDFQRIGFQEDDDAWLPADVDLTVVDLSSPGTDNLAVTSAVLERDVEGGRERLTAGARVTYKAPVESAPMTTRIQLELDGRSVQTKTLELPPNSSATVGFEPHVIPKGITRGTIRIDEDALSADNAYHFVLSPGQALSVLGLVSGPSSARRSFFVERALALGDRPSFRVTTKSMGELRAADLATADVVLLNDPSSIGQDTAKLVEEFVSKGGGLVIAFGEASSKNAFPGEAAKLLPAPPSATTVDRARDWGGTLSYLDYGNPIFEIFGAPGSGDFSSAKFFRYRTFDAPIADGVLARFDDGAPALVERRLGEGRILVWTSTLDTFWNDLARQPVFLPFVHQLVKRAASYAEASAWQTVGEVADLDRYISMVLRGEGGAPEKRDYDLVVSSPSSKKTILSRDEERAFLTLEEQGFYEVRPAGGSSPGGGAVSLAVNLDPAESDLSRLDPEELVAAVTLGQNVLGGTGGGGASDETPRTQEARQGYWWFLLVGAFLLLASETLLANRLSLSKR